MSGIGESWMESTTGMVLINERNVRNTRLVARYFMSFLQLNWTDEELKSLED